VYFNGTQMFTYTDSNNVYPAGQPGIADAVFGGPTVMILSFSGGVLSSGGGDTTPPVLTNGQPTGVLSSGTTTTTLSLTTNEVATCRYATSAGVAYGSMTNTFSSTGGTSQSTTVTGLNDGGSYTYYVRCQDSAGNANSSDYVITFSVNIASQGGVVAHTIQISNDGDDGYYDSNGWHSTPQSNGADLVGSWGGTTTAWATGYRFPATGIASGDPIQTTYLELVSSDGAASSVTCGSAPCASSNYSFRVYGVAEDDGAAFSSTTGNTPLDVPYTTAYTDYTTTGPGDVHGGCQGNNNGQNTCTHIIDVSAIVREVTSRPGWTANSALRFVLVSADATAPNAYAGYEDYSANSARAATLLVNPPTPTIVSSGAWGTSAQATYPTSYATGPFVYPGASTLLLFLGDYYNFYGQAVPQPTVSDSCGNTWNLLAGPTDWAAITYLMRSTVYYVTNPAACPSGDTITVNVAIQEPIFLHFLAVAGSGSPVASAITSPNPGTYTTSATTAPLAMNGPGLLVSWAFGDSDAPHVFTPQQGFATDLNSTPTYLTAAFESVPSAGSYQNQFSISPSPDGWQAVMIGLPSLAVAPPVITSASSANAIAGESLSYQITATNSPLSFGASGLPPGLAVNTASGLISGTPSATGTFNATITATNSKGTASASLALTVTAVPPVITSGNSASGIAGSAFSYQITASNLPASFGASGLPSGLLVNSTSGLISGTPSAAGVSTVTLSATNSAGTSAAHLTLTVTGVPVISSPTTATGTAGTAFSYQITATNSPTNFGASGLPTGLTINSTSGLISGTPSAPGIFTVALTAMNGSGTGSASLVLTINSSGVVSSQFSGTENPLSENGRWSTTGSWASLKKNNGVFGTAVTAGALLVSPVTGPDQFAEITYDQDPGTASWPGVMTRVQSASNGSGYLAIAYAESVRLYRTDDTGTLNFTLLASANADTGAAPRLLRLESQGSSHTVYFNGAQMFSYTDSNNVYPTGQPGIADAVFGGPTVMILSFTGGVLSSGGGDTTPPVLTNGQPTGVLSSGTTTATLSLTTNEAATCRYATSAGVAYGSMTNTFSSTGGTSQSTTLTGLTGGGSYSYYVRCQDSAGNVNSNDYAIAFSVAASSGVVSSQFSGTENPLSENGRWSTTGSWASLKKNNGVFGTAVTAGALLVNPVTGPDQFAEISYDQDPGTASWPGVMTRVQSASNGSGYLAIAYADSVRLYRTDDTGTLNFTLLASANADIGAAPRLLRLESRGSSHTVYFNGTQMFTYTDSNNVYPAGQPGIADAVFGGPTVMILSFSGGVL
jgi:hypothetical protein